MTNTTHRRRIHSEIPIVRHHFQSQNQNKAVWSDVPDSKSIEVILRLRASAKHKKHIADHLALPHHQRHHHRVSHDEARVLYSSDLKKSAIVKSYLQSKGIKKIVEKYWHRSIHFTASVQLINSLFKIKLKYYTTKVGKHIGYKGHLYMDKKIHPYIAAVYGLNEKIHPRVTSGKKAAPKMYPPFDHSQNPLTMASWYQLPTKEYTGKGQTIGIIEFGGGYDINTLQSYFKEINVKPSPIKDILLDGVKNNPDDPNYILAYETFMDVEVVAGIATGAEQILVFFTQNHRSNFIHVLSEAILGDKENSYKTPDIISSSWGDLEKNFTKEQIDDINHLLLFASTKGVTCIHASGDHGATGAADTNLPNVFFPASSPWNLSTGGVQITKLKDDLTEIIEQVAWNVTIPGLGNQSTGGGFSTVFKRPEYQNSFLPKNKDARGVPDVAANANFIHAMKVFVKNQDDPNKPIKTTSYGTSAAAPFWAAYIALCNEALALKGLPTVGFINPALYAIAKKNKNAFTDILKGNNILFEAAKGWDACTGLGCMHGTILLEEFIRFYSRKKKKK